MAIVFSVLAGLMGTCAALVTLAMGDSFSQVLWNYFLAASGSTLALTGVKIAVSARIGVRLNA